MDSATADGRRGYQVTAAGLALLGLMEPPKRERCCRCHVRLGGPIKAVRRKNGQYQCRDQAICAWRITREFGRRQLAWEF